MRPIFEVKYKDFNYISYVVNICLGHKENKGITLMFEYYHKGSIRHKGTYTAYLFNNNIEACTFKKIKYD